MVSGHSVNFNQSVERWALLLGMPAPERAAVGGHSDGNPVRAGAQAKNAPSLPAIGKRRPWAGRRTEVPTDIGLVRQKIWGAHGERPPGKLRLHSVESSLTNSACNGTLPPTDGFRNRQSVIF